MGPQVPERRHEGRASRDGTLFTSRVSSLDGRLLGDGRGLLLVRRQERRGVHEQLLVRRQRRLAGVRQRGGRDVERVAVQEVIRHQQGPRDDAARTDADEAARLDRQASREHLPRAQVPAVGARVEVCVADAHDRLPPLLLLGRQVEAPVDLDAHVHDARVPSRVAGRHVLRRAGQVAAGVDGGAELRLLDAVVRVDDVLAVARDGRRLVRRVRRLHVVERRRRGPEVGRAVGHVAGVRREPRVRLPVLALLREERHGRVEAVLPRAVGPRAPERAQVGRPALVWARRKDSPRDVRVLGSRGARRVVAREGPPGARHALVALALARALHV
mmetsp:Transcript_27093/g.87736  ORF Transcript_27093/g.87736 Transcript_27093/m.87736 type:complete len:330 (+) Transcript_27093:1088-2077(+)